MNNYPNTFAFVQIHGDDIYATAWGNARMTFFQDFAGYPTSYCDDVTKREGAYSYSTYLADYNTRRGVPTDVTIQLGGYQLSGQTYRILARVCVEPGGVGKTMRFHLVHVLDHWPPIPPPEAQYSRNGVRVALTSGTAGNMGDVITVAAGECLLIEKDITFDATSWGAQSDIRMIAWAQENQTSSPPSNRAEVYQAGLMSWPFPPLQRPGDMNNDGSVNMADVPYFIMALSDRAAYDALFPTVDADEVGDTNDDGFFNGGDTDSFIDLVLYDIYPPTPDPMTWEVYAEPASTSSVYMLATQAVDLSGVEYRFYNGASAPLVGWQAARDWTHTGLTPNNLYSYKVRARDLSPEQNETQLSTPTWYTATAIQTPTGMSFANITSSSLDATALGTFTNLGSNESGLYFEMTPDVPGSGANTWTHGTTNTTINVTGLAPNTTYTFRVKARNFYGTRGPQYETPWTDYFQETTAP